MIKKIYVKEKHDVPPLSKGNRSLNHINLLTFYIILLAIVKHKIKLTVAWLIRSILSAKPIKLAQADRRRRSIFSSKKISNRCCVFLSQSNRDWIMQMDG